MPRTCKTPKCPKEASYGLESDRKRISCAGHKDDDHVQLTGKKCKTSGCSTVASFGLAGDRKRISCVDHKDDDHVQLNGKKCETSGCPKEASFGLESDRKRISCAGHKDDEYINLIAKKCETSGCPKVASFGLESDRKRISCTGHKDDDHVQLHGNKCKCGQFFVARKGDSCATCNPSSNPSSLWYNLKCNLTLYILNLIGLTNLSEVWFSRNDSLCKDESQRKFGRIDGLLISNSANNSNSIWSFECNEFHHERNEVKCDSGRYLANVLNYMKVYKEPDGSFPSLIHLYFNPDLGHSRSESTNESNEARSTFLTKNIINLLKSISYIEKQKHQPSNCYIYFINYEQTYYDNYNNVEKNAKCIKLVNETIENEDLYTNELKNVLCQKPAKFKKNDECYCLKHSQKTQHKLPPKKHW